MDERAFPREGSMVQLSWLRCKLVPAVGWGQVRMLSTGALAVLGFHNPLSGSRIKWRIKLSKLSVS